MPVIIFNDLAAGKVAINLLVASCRLPVAIDSVSWTTEAEGSLLLVELFAQTVLVLTVSEIAENGYCSFTSKQSG